MDAVCFVVCHYYFNDAFASGAQPIYFYFCELVSLDLQRSSRRANSVVAPVFLLVCMWPIMAPGHTWALWRSSSRIRRRKNFAWVPVLLLVCTLSILAPGRTWALWTAWFRIRRRRKLVLVPVLFPVCTLPMMAPGRTWHFEPLRAALPVIMFCSMPVLL